MKKQLTKDEALARLQALCARSEQCSPDIRKKLTTWMIPAGDIEDIMALLMRHKFVDDNRFAHAYANDKMRFSGWGRYKIMMGLRQKRLSVSLIDSALSDLDAEEYAATARRVLIARARSIAEGNTYEGRTKLFRFGASRGFETELLSRLIRAENLWQPESCDD